MGDDFTDFCRALAAAIRVDLSRMDKFGGELPWRSIDDAVVPLLSQTDRTGSFAPGQCRDIARRLRQLARAWPAGDFARQVALEMSDGLETAAYYGRPFKWYVD